MKTFTRYALIVAIFFGAFLVIPYVVSAAGNPAEDLWSGGYWGPILECHGVTNSTTPACSDLGICGIFSTAQNIIYLLMSALIYAIAPLLFVVGGIMILFAGANPSALSEGKKVLTGALIGVAISLGAFLIVDQVFSAITSLSSIQIDWKNIQCDERNLPVVTPRQPTQAPGTGN